MTQVLGVASCSGSEVGLRHILEQAQHPHSPVPTLARLPILRISRSEVQTRSQTKLGPVPSSLRRAQRRERPKHPW